MNKKIITIAEIVFALVFVVLLSVFMATINSKGNQANNQLVDTLEMSNGTSIDKYVKMGKDEIVKGTDVVNVATNYKTIGGNTKLEVVVITGKDEKTTSTYGYKTSSEKTDPKVAAGTDLGGYTQVSSTDKKYINPAGDFTVKTRNNLNGICDQITFTQKF